MTYVPYCGIIAVTTIIVALSFILPMLIPLPGSSSSEFAHRLNKRSQSNAKQSLADDVSRSGGFLGSVEEIGEFRRLLTPFLRERVSGTEGNLRVQEHILRELSDLGGWRLTEDRFTAETPLGPKQFTNIVADLNPPSTSRVTLACHFDSKFFDGFVFVGATDSAVPCALLLDLARNLNDSLWRSVEDGASTSLQLIFFDGEEAFLEWSDKDSLYGSRHLAEKMEEWRIPTDETTSMSVIETMSVLILLDLVGTVNCQFRNWFPRTSHLYLKFQDIEKRLFGAGLLDPLGRTSAEFERGRYFPDKSIPKMMMSGIADDHVPFMSRNVSILHLISYPFPSVWHKASDNEEALSYPAINNLARILRVFIVEHLGLLL